MPEQVGAVASEATLAHSVADAATARADEAPLAVAAAHEAAERAGRRLRGAAGQAAGP